MDRFCSLDSYRRRVMLATLIVFFALAACNAAMFAAASAQSQVSALEVAPGVAYQVIDIETPRGTARAHVIEVDLSHPDVYVDLLYPGVVASALPLSEMAALSGAVAAVNGDFFNISATQAGVVPTNAPVGPAIASGVVLKAAVPTRQRFGPSLPLGASVDDVIGVGEDGVARVARLTLHGTIVTSEGVYPLAGLNQYAIAQRGIGAFTSDWGSVSRRRATCGTDSRREDPCSVNVFEVIVTDGRVASVSDQPGEGEIPDGSVVLLGRETGADRLRTLRLGDPVSIEYELRSTVDVPFRFAVGGQPLVRDGGAVPGLDNQVAAVRSAAGISPDGLTLYLFSLERGKSGMTYAEVASLLLSLGASSGVNLDGGGSSTLVVRDEIGGGITAVNLAPGEAERRIPNGIGVFVRP